MLARARLLVPALLASVLTSLVVPSPAAAAKPQRSRRAAQLPGPVHYHVAIPEPTTRYVQVTVAVADAPEPETTLAMPAWTPGSYLIRDFGKQVYDFTAHTADGRALAVRRIDKQRWTVANEGRGFTAEYRVFADDLSVRTSYVDDQFSLLNGASVFMYVEGETERAATLELEPPTGWTAHTALDAGPDSRGASAAALPRYAAPNYDELVDSPILLGDAGVVEVRRFEVAGKPIELVYAAAGGSNADLDRVAADAEQIVRAFARTLNGLPFDHYSFLVVADEVGGGGLEHHDSTALVVRPFGFGTEAGYAGMQRLMAHEFFHLWNVKRIHDVALGPFDYSRETYSDLLWFHEGLTETMETRAMLRTGLVSADAYLAGLEAAWNGYIRKPGRNAAPISELSREAWIKSYQPEANHRETTISYYEKGNLIGACLDLELRLRARATHTGGSLEGLFRRLWADRDPATGEAAITVEDVIAAASAEAGEDMRWFFDRYVYGTEELPLPELLSRAGFVIEAEPVAGDEDPRAGVWTGLAGAATISSIEPDSPAASAGLMLGDELIAVDGKRVQSVTQAHERLADLALGSTATISLFRRERLEARALTTQASPHQRWSFSRPEQPGDGELARLRELWLLEQLVR